MRRPRRPRGWAARPGLPASGRVAESVLIAAAALLLLTTCSPYGAWDLLGMRALVEFPEYGRALPMKLDNTGQGETLADFPLLITLTAARFEYAHAAPGGADLRFVTGDGEATLPHEIEQWNHGGTSRVWVQVPRIPGGGTAEIALLYAGPEGVVPEDPAELWKDYELVFHLTALTLDSGPAGGTGALVGTPSAAQGKIAGGAQVTSVGGDHIDTNYTAAPILRDGWTVEAWVKGNAGPTDGTLTGGITGPVIGGDTFNISWDHTAASLRPAAHAHDGSQFRGAKFGGGLSGSTWYHLAGVYDGSVPELRAYLDGDWVVTNTEIGSPLNLSVADTLIGTLDGIVDEVRVSARVRSADWIRAQYLSMTDGLITYGETLTR